MKLPLLLFFSLQVMDESNPGDESQQEPEAGNLSICLLMKLLQVLQVFVDSGSPAQTVSTVVFTGYLHNKTFF